MTVDCIISQTALKDGRPLQQITNLALDGISTRKDAENTDKGKIYGAFTYSASQYVLTLYRDVLKTDEVATATSSALGAATIIEANDSGLSGTVNFAQYNADDSSIEITCCLSVDSDIPMAHLEGLSDYDATTGFADFHIRAFDKIKEIIISRYKSVVFNRDMIDTRNVVGSLGGYDLSRILNWSAFREAAGHYVLYQLCERQTVEPGSVFDVRATQSRNIFKAHLESIDVNLDTNADRVEDKSRTMNTFKISRA